MKTNCKNCGNELERRPSRMKNGRNYCNASCQMKYEYRTGSRDRFEITKIANEVFKTLTKNDLEWSNNRKEKARKAREDIIKVRGRFHTESGLARLKDRKGNKNPMYGKPAWNRQDNGLLKSRYIKHPEWLRIKKLALIRDNFICQSCGIDDLKSKVLFNKQSLQVHHLIPYRVCREHKMNNLITLCCSCHSKATAIEQQHLIPVIK